MNHLPDRMRSERGITLIETMMTLGIMAIVGGMAAAQMSTVRRSMQGDGAMRLVMSEITTAREMAMTQRRLMEVQFIGGNWVRIVRHELTNNQTTIVHSVALEGGVTFSLVPQVPDTPDAFGNSSALAFGAAQILLFNGEGSLVDSSGSPINGTVFLSISSRPESARAVTVLGSTGRVRGYRWAASNPNAPGWNRV